MSDAEEDAQRDVARRTDDSETPVGDRAAEPQVAKKDHSDSTVDLVDEFSDGEEDRPPRR